MTEKIKLMEVIEELEITQNVIENRGDNHTRNSRYTESIRGAVSTIRTLAKRNAGHELYIQHLAQENEELEQKLSECYKLFEKHIALLLRLSAFDAPEAKGLALALNTEVARIKSIGEQQEPQE